MRVRLEKSKIKPGSGVEVGSGPSVGSSVGSGASVGSSVVSGSSVGASVSGLVPMDKRKMFYTFVVVIF